MSMDLYSTRIPWKDKRKDPKYINFNSEVVVRKGNEGWVINSKLDNYTNGAQTYFDYILTTYKYEGGQWKQENTKWWNDSRILDGDVGIYDLQDEKGQVIYAVNTHSTKLVIKTPKESWWNGTGWISTSGSPQIVKKTKTETKEWAGIWIDDSDNGEDSWIFEDIELYIENKKNSLMFCKEDENCFDVYQSSDKTSKLNKQNPDTWTEILNSQPNNETDTVATMLTKTVKPIIDKIKDSRGTWLDLETVCNLKGTRNLNDSQKKQLSMYCTNGQKT